RVAASHSPPRPSGVPRAGLFREAEIRPAGNVKRHWHVAGEDRPAFVHGSLHPVDARNREALTSMGRPHSAHAAAFYRQVGARLRQRGIGRYKQHAPARRASMLHARNDLLPDIAALAEADAICLVQKNVVREGIAKLIVLAAFGDAMGDAQAVPGRWIVAFLCGRTIASPHIPTRKSDVHTGN